MRLTTNERPKARQFGDTYWPYVVWDPTAAGAAPLLVQNPASWPVEQAGARHA